VIGGDAVGAPDVEAKVAEPRPEPPDGLIGWLTRCRLVPVVVVDEPTVATALGQTLVDAGLPVAEVTLRTPRALECLAAMASVPDLVVGAGTVTSVADADRARSAGAAFVVSPGFSEPLGAWAVAHHVAYLPGVATPSEIMAAGAFGFSVVKLFPAQTLGGPAAVRALAGPFPDVRFVPTGGIGPDNLLDYLRLPAVVACGGSWVVGRSLVAAGELEEVGRRVRAARGAIDGLGDPA
jgi:2-dehydro-3-deoxyphosphogluconate aldolase/(4S)-4-hydroxy-2-oxoglutarate aldolase